MSYVLVKAPRKQKKRVQKSGSKIIYVNPKPKRQYRPRKPKLSPLPEEIVEAGYGSRYTPYAGMVGSGIGTMIGSTFGGPVGAVAGGMAGRKLGQAVTEGIKYFTGFGDYKVINNSFLNSDSEMTPVINKTAGGGDVFRRSEYMGDIISSSSANTFKIQSYPVNPGLESTFQWLSQVAANYEEYSFEGLYFEFRSMSADALNSTNTALGQVIMAMNYNAAAPNFTNKQSMENYEGGISGKPSTSIRYFVECAKLRTVLDELYIRQGEVPDNQDARLYDLGNFQIATNGMQGTSVNLGELWVCYQVVLRKPKLFSALGLYGSYAYINPTGGTYTNALPFGNIGTWNYSSSNTLIGVVATGTTLKFSSPSLPQTYILYLSWGGNSTPITVPTLAVEAANNGIVIQSGGFVPITGTATASVSAFYIITYQPTLQTNGLLVTGVAMSTGGTLPASGVTMNIYIMQVPNTLYAV